VGNSIWKTQFFIYFLYFFVFEDTIKQKNLKQERLNYVLAALVFDREEAALQYSNPNFSFANGTEPDLLKIK
jgi:hypothetical protein